jgi:hypothetical protein
MFSRGFRGGLRGSSELPISGAMNHMKKKKKKTLHLPLKEKKKHVSIKLKHIRFIDQKI